MTEMDAATRAYIERIAEMAPPLNTEQIALLRRVLLSKATDTAKPMSDAA